MGRPSAVKEANIIAEDYKSPTPKTSAIEDGGGVAEKMPSLKGSGRLFQTES